MTFQENWIDLICNFSTDNFGFFRLMLVYLHQSTSGTKIWGLRTYTIALLLNLR